MKFYYFGGAITTEKSNIDLLEDSNCDGVLFTYRQVQGDFFTHIARTMRLDQKIKYMVAIRPHALSAQYLCMINQSINEIQKNRLLINIISGHIKPDEIDFGGILGEVTDRSSIPDRVNYMIDYLKELKSMEKNGVSVPECWVTCTNIYALTEVAKLDYNIIFPYRQYKDGYFLDKSVPGQVKPGDKVDLSNKRIMLAISPIIRDTQEEINREFPKNILVHTYGGGQYIDRPRFAQDTEYFTYEQFIDFIKKIESEGIKEILFNEYPESERNSLIKYIKKYTESH